jgi:hypothetical protein
LTGIESAHAEVDPWSKEMGPMFYNPIPDLIDQWKIYEFDHPFYPGEFVFSTLNTIATVYFTT